MAEENRQIMAEEDKKLMAEIRDKIMTVIRRLLKPFEEFLYDFWSKEKFVYHWTETYIRKVILIVGFFIALYFGLHVMVVLTDFLNRCSLILLDVYMTFFELFSGLVIIWLKPTFQMLLLLFKGLLKILGMPLSYLANKYLNSTIEEIVGK